VRYDSQFWNTRRERLFAPAGQPTGVSSSSLTGLFGLAITLAFATPVALLGLQLLGDGRTTFGAGLLAIAVLMVLINEYVASPGDLPGMLAGKVVGTVVKEPEDEEE